MRLIKALQILNLIMYDGTDISTTYPRKLVGCDTNIDIIDEMAPERLGLYATESSILRTYLNGVPFFATSSAVRALSTGSDITNVFIPRLRQDLLTSV